MSLTVRQKQILQLLVDGQAPKQIAAQLAISRKTVGKHLATIRLKYAVATRSEMIAQSVVRGDVYVCMGDSCTDSPFPK